MRTLPGTPTLLPPGWASSNAHRLAVHAGTSRAGRRGGAFSRPLNVSTWPPRVGIDVDSRRRRCPSFAARRRSARAWSRTRRRPRFRPGAASRRPASAARGSAALTMPAERRRWACGPWRGPAAHTGEREQQAASKLSERIGGALPAPHSLGNVGKALALEPLGQPARDAPRDPGPLIDHRACRAGRGSRRRGCAPTRRRHWRSRRRRSAGSSPPLARSEARAAPRAPAASAARPTGRPARSR